MLCPCHSPAMPCHWAFRMRLSHLIYTVRPCLIHTCHAAPMPCSDHAVLLKAIAIKRRPVGCLPALGFFQLPRRVPRRLLSEAYHSSSQRFIPTTVKSSSSSSSRDDLLSCWTSSSDISGYHTDLHEGHDTLGAWWGMAWHVWINAQHGMGTACSVWISLYKALMTLIWVMTLHLRIPEHKMVSCTHQ
jgi:hypothetical protein